MHRLDYHLRSRRACIIEAGTGPAWRLSIDSNLLPPPSSTGKAERDRCKIQNSKRGLLCLQIPRAQLQLDPGSWFKALRTADNGIEHGKQSLLILLI